VTATGGWPRNKRTNPDQRKEHIMSFVQVIDYKSSKPEEIQRIHDEWTEATKGKRSAKRIMLAKYHDDPNSFCEIVFFDSYEDAMRNSKLPETQEFAKRLKNAIDGEPTYFDLDVVEEQTL
jgi:quinol monooxygenase YgiN